MVITSLSPAEITRYAQQLRLPGWGPEAQEKLKLSRVLIAGVGGVGSAAAFYLLGGGVGALRLVDPARVRLSDLSYQVLYREQDLNKAKATVAEKRLKENNSFTLMESWVKTISAHNVFRLSSGCHLILDATNQAAASLILHQAAAKLRIPLVRAWIRDLTGGLTTFCPGPEPCPAAARPETSQGKPPAPPALLSPLPGILGALQALEAMRILGGQAPALSGRILCFDGNNLQFVDKFL